MEFIDLLAAPPEVQEAWSCCEALRRLGFDPNEVTAFPDPRDSHLKILVRVGPRAYDYDCGRLTLDADAFIALWSDLIVDLIHDNIPHAILDQTWNSSQVKFSFPEIVDGLHDEGFYIPALDEEEPEPGISSIA